ncbi:MAG: heavy-metal-associated domain-containing protein [Proteobacteria bacterium]|nr:heavy-metal-associated domain-containing protein [Pseudomonadota bacterium]
MIEFQVADMTCGHCASVITRAVKSVEVAARVEIDLKARRVRIEGPVDAQEIRDAIRDAGYSPAPAPAPAG